MKITLLVDQQKHDFLQGEFGIKFAFIKKICLVFLISFCVIFGKYSETTGWELKTN